MATIKLAETAVGALRLQRLKTKMVAFVLEHPDDGIETEQFFNAINADISIPQVADEVATGIRNAIKLFDAITADVLDAPSPGAKRSAPPPPQDDPRSPRLAGSRGARIHLWPGAPRRRRRQLGRPWAPWVSLRRRSPSTTAAL